MLGEMCHIKAAKPNGPRYDLNQSAAQRHDVSNLILLCANHHKVIDDDEVAYTVERLQEMKALHETSSGSLDEAAVSAGANLLFSSGQTGGWVTGTVHAQTINIHANDRAPDSDAAGLTAVALLGPEVGRLLARQIHVLDRATVNFVSASVRHPQPPDHWTTFVPWKPVHYRNASQTRDLTPADAALLAEFYDCLTEIDDLVTGWQDSATAWDMNLWNFLMQKIERSVITGLRAAERFCPARQYDATMPASGTLQEQAERSVSQVKAALDAHIKRHSPNSQLRP